MSEHRFTTIITRMIWMIFIVVVLAITATAGIKFFQNIEQRLGLAAMLLAILTAIAACYLVQKFARPQLTRAYLRMTRLCSERTGLLLLIIVAVSVITRVLWLFLFQINQFESDYEGYHTRAEQYAAGQFMRDDYAALFPHVFGFAYVLGGVYKLFGSAIVVSQLFNLFLYLVAIVLLWYLFPARKYPISFLMSALFVSLWPSLIYFNTLANTEYLFIVCLLGFLLLLKHVVRKRFIATIGMVILLMVFIVLSNFVRPIGNIFVIAFLIVLFFQFTSLSILKRVALAGVALVVFSFGSSYIYGQISRHVQLEVATLPVGFNLFVGSNPEKRGEDVGLWNMDDSSKLGQAYEKYGDAQKAHDEMLSNALDRYKQTLSNGQIIPFAYAKAKTAWGSDSWALLLIESHMASFHKSESSLKLYQKLHTPLIALGDLLYLAFLVAVAWLIIRKWRSKELYAQGTVAFTSALFLIGMFLMLLMVESAPRYHVPGLIALLLVAAQLLNGSSKTVERPQ